MNRHSDLHYICRGEQNNPPVVFLHGFMGSSADWNQVIELLIREFYCIAIDLPGHGKSPISADTNFENLIENLDSLIESLSLKNPAVVGYSMGGRIALNWIVNFPGRFARIVLESATAGIENPQERSERIQQDLQLAKRLENEPFQDFPDEWYGLPLFGRIKYHKDYKELVKGRLKNSPGNLALALNAFSTGKQKSLWPHISKLAIPGLLICGQEDNKYVQIMTELNKLNNHFDITIFKNCGHSVHFENPIRFAEHLVQFLSL